MTVLNLKTAAAKGPAEKSGFFRRLWQSILRFDEALNFDPGRILRAGYLTSNGR
jgi:hypothetical protein